jgi:hypothetical protein
VNQRSSVTSVATKSAVGQREHDRSHWDEFGSHRA